jgi:tetratricopeptide (TPR) repeat protein
MTSPTRRTSWTTALVLLVITTLAPWTRAMADPQAIAAKAFDLRLVGQVDEAIQMLEAGLKEHPDAGVLHYELARARLYLLEIEDMFATAEAAVRCEPENNDYRYFAAMAAGYALIDAAHHQDRERMKTMGEHCFEHLEAILATDPDDNRARCFLVELNVEMAPQIGREVSGNEEHVKLLEQKDAVLAAKARSFLVGEEEAVEIWKELVAEHPDDCRALAEAADGLILAGELDLARDCLDKAMDKDKTYCYGLLRLGLAHVMSGDVEGALQLTDRYLDTRPPVALEAFAIGRKGVIHRRNGNHDLGRKLVAEAEELDPHVWLTVMPPPREIFTPL